MIIIIARLNYFFTLANQDGKILQRQILYQQEILSEFDHVKEGEIGPEICVGAYNNLLRWQINARLNIIIFHFGCFYHFNKS
jgi:hypothetical protein